MSLQKLILRRSLEILIIFFVILSGLFLLFHIAPGDPVSRMVDPDRKSTRLNSSHYS